MSRAEPQRRSGTLPILWQWTVFVCCSGFCWQGLNSTSRAAPIDFGRDIRPILSDKCFSCHGPDAAHREADLRLDVQASAMADRGGYQVVFPGSSARSRLWERITTTQLDERMPPPDSGKVLTDHERELLQRWLDSGANWTQHWAYVPPVEQPIPPVRRSDWPRHWIDHFVLARLEQQQLQPSPDANPTTLLRRLSFDLTGLPPDATGLLGSIDALDNSGSDDRLVDYDLDYEPWVDRLLASPHFGERMAMYWLDLVRYADTVGYHGDQDHNISPYRDYVIDAFNDNLPFDRFTHEQLAGDLLPGAGTDQRIASGYNRLLQTSHEGGVQPQEYLTIYAADRVRNLSAVWLGATLGCAQCHDHKFDPYRAQDFYAMAAFFADVDEAQHFAVGGNELPTKRPPEETVLTQRERLRLEQLQATSLDLQQQLDGASDNNRAAIKQQLAKLASRQQSIQVNRRMTMISVSLSEPRTVRVLPRGNWLDQSGPVVTPAVPEFLGTLKSDASDRRANRLDLARWLTDDQQGIGGLTARVFVNRVWYLLLGRGLAPTLDDFGAQGKPPIHDHLLDRLALEFMASGWDVKHLVRQIVLSRTYRQSSSVNRIQWAADPSNQWLARQGRFRLPAEMIRDNAMAVSGLLTREMGGASCKPYQPPGYYRHLNFPPREYQSDADRQQWRRGVYVHWQRQFLHPTLRALDATNREECTAQRPQSNTPLAALALLNDPSFVESARAFAIRILRESPDASDDQRLDFAMSQALFRRPDEWERDQLRALLDASRADFAREPSAAEQLVQIGLASTPSDTDPRELAAWTTVSRVIMNLHEFVTRN